MDYFAASGRKYRSNKHICTKIQGYNSRGQAVTCINNPGKDQAVPVDAQAMMYLQLGLGAAQGCGH